MLIVQRVEIIGSKTLHKTEWILTKDKKYCTPKFLFDCTSSHNTNTYIHNIELGNTINAHCSMNRNNWIKDTSKDRMELKQKIKRIALQSLCLIALQVTTQTHTSSLRFKSRDISHYKIYKLLPKYIKA